MLLVVLEPPALLLSLSLLQSSVCSDRTKGLGCVIQTGRPRRPSSLMTDLRQRQTEERAAALHHIAQPPFSTELQSPANVSWQTLTAIKNRASLLQPARTWTCSAACMVPTALLRVGLQAHQMRPELCVQVAHRDLKSANILIARDFTAKIADVGELEAL